MKSLDGYNVTGNLSTKSYTSSYASSDTTLPASMRNVSAMPVNFYLNYLVSPYINNYSYDNNQVSYETKEVMNARKYNDRGLLIQTTIVTKKIKPLGTDDQAVMQFEYVEL